MSFSEDVQSPEARINDDFGRGYHVHECTQCKPTVRTGRDVVLDGQNKSAGFSLGTWPQRELRDVGRQVICVVQDEARHGRRIACRPTHQKPGNVRTGRVVYENVSLKRRASKDVAPRGVKRESENRRRQPRLMINETHRRTWRGLSHFHQAPRATRRRDTLNDSHDL